MKRVIIESPYGSTDPAIVERNIRYLRACMRDCVLRGESPYASHGLLTQPGVLDDNVPEERELGINAGFAWRSAAELTVVYTDLGISKGMEHGIANARDHGITVEHRKLGEMWDQATVTLTESDVIRLIDEGVSTFSAMQTRMGLVDEKGDNGWRRLDRMLQGMRRRGLIFYSTRHRCWRIAGLYDAE